jgi:hypothetical protein
LDGILKGTIKLSDLQFKYEELMAELKSSREENEALKERLRELESNQIIGGSASRSTSPSLNYINQLDKLSIKESKGKLFAKETLNS